MAELRPIERPFGRRAADRYAGWAQTLAVLRVILSVGAVVLAIGLLYELRSLILLIALSVFFAYLVAPLVAVVNRPWATGRGRTRRMSPALAVGVVYLLLLGMIIIVGAAVGPRLSAQAEQMIQNAPTYVEALQGHIGSAVGVLDRLGLPPTMRQGATNALRSMSGSLEQAGRSAAGILLGIVSYLPWVILVPILAFFLLKDAETFRRGAVGLLPEGRSRLHATAVFERINRVLAAYVRAQLLACALIAILVAVGFALLGVPYGIVLGVLAGLAEFIPLVGPLVVAVLAAAIAGFHAPILAVWVLLFLGILRVAEDYVVYPRLVGGGMHMHPLTIILAVLAGAELGGIPGIFLAVPVVAILIVLYRYYAEVHEASLTAERRLA